LKGEWLNFATGISNREVRSAQTIVLQNVEQDIHSTGRMFDDKSAAAGRPRRIH
jgi:hypothetical protein